MAHKLPAASARWRKMVGHAGQQWNRLTEDDLADVRGNSERLISALQLRYGLARHQALLELATWRQTLQAAGVRES